MEKNKAVELSDSELEQVSGGGENESFLCTIDNATVTACAHPDQASECSYKTLCPFAAQIMIYKVFQYPGDV